ncbi:MAG TPA: hypothetical protein VF456_03770 [Vicinamibacterales bacterium]
MKRLSIVVWCACAMGVLAIAPLSAQESKLGADLRLEGKALASKCDDLAPKSLVDCATTLITDHPFHLAVGSLAPKNGFGFGLAFVAPQSKPNDDWRINWSADIVGTPSAAWRAGAYARLVNSRVPGIGVVGPDEGTSSTSALPRPYPTFALYAQTTSLPTVSYFGLGNQTSAADRTSFALRESTIGGGAFWPIARTGLFNRLNPVALFDLNGRWVRVAGSTSGESPAIDSRFTDLSAPGLSAQPATIQVSEGLRIAPAIGRVQLTYSGYLQQYVAPSETALSFRRWTVDLGHELLLWTTSRQSGARDTNGPNECATSVDRTIGEYGCPDPTIVTTNRVGSVGFRVIASSSAVSNGSRVPFYFQRTLGGSDIDGQRLLASYDDYRFRGPRLLALQQTIEHVIWGPIGAFAAAEEGRVALIGESLTTGTLRKSFGGGITLRVGGAPVATVGYAHGDEGHHFIMTVNSSLFGGSARPSLQ